MNYISTPLSYIKIEPSPEINRNLKELTAMIDNLVDLIIFTPKGSFLADPDFGFEYWNHEYANVDYKNFNNGQSMTATGDFHHEIAKAECQDSIRNSLLTYVPQLTNINVNMELSSTFEGLYGNEDIKSKHTAKIVVEGSIENELGTYLPYKREVVFFTEPTLIKHR